MIIGVAIEYDGLVVALHRPNRHHNIIHLVYEKSNKVTKGSDRQGFIDHNGKFLTRYEAAHHAFQVGQLQDKYDGKLQGPRWIQDYIPDELYSEDLW